jgi:hypothetical protein
VGDLTLPLRQSFPTDGTVFEIDQPTDGGIAIQASSFGRDRDGRSGTGVLATSDTGFGVQGTSPSGTGVFGTSDTGFGVQGNSASGTGVCGTSNSGNGMEGKSATLSGVWGHSQTGAGVTGSCVSGPGVQGSSSGADGVIGRSTSTQHAGVSAINETNGAHAYGLWARGTPAGNFEGNVIVHGDIQVTGDVTLNNMDCAEDFDICGTEEIEPGTVMVIEVEGALKTSRSAYDKRVAGVVSGAGTLKPGIVLGRQEPQGKRMPIALLGRVYCKVDANSSPIEVGDLLTTSPTPGHAMKVLDPPKAFGAVIGKALRPLETGRALIPILIALQ